MKKQTLKKLQLNKKRVAAMLTKQVKGGLSGFCEPSEDQPSDHNPMDSNYRSVCIGCEESMGILC